MRILFILAFALVTTTLAFAQRTVHPQPIGVKIDNSGRTGYGTHTVAKNTAIGDTLVLSNIAATDTNLVIYSAGADSGYLTGTDVYNDKGFAERYDIDTSADDSSLVVIGVVAVFHGVVKPASANTVTFNLWGQSPPYVLAATKSYSSFPGFVLDSVQVPVTQLGIGILSDTPKTFLFNAVSVKLQTSFFLGYTINYNFNTLSGDTLGLACSADGHRTSNYASLIGYVDTVVISDTAHYIPRTDTIINVQNATMWSDNSWHDNYTDNDSISNNLAVYPIVVVSGPTGVRGITRNNLTLFGNYPNPATCSTSVKFSLAHGANVTLQVLDMSGRVISNVTENPLSAGEHIIPVNTSALPAGDYIYLLHTSDGDGMAAKMSVVR